MSEALASLNAKVAATGNTDEGIVALLADLSARLKAAGTDGGKLAALASEIDTCATAWAKAIADKASAAQEGRPPARRTTECQV